MVYFCYIDESGTPQVPGNTSHYVLCGVSIPVKFWKKCDRTHKEGTLWTSIKHIVETPFFVDSELTGMIQIADLCSIALRRFFENGDTDLFNRISPRFDKHHGKLVGVRHFTEPTCSCEVCANR